MHGRAKSSGLSESMRKNDLGIEQGAYDTDSGKLLGCISKPMIDRSMLVKDEGHNTLIVARITRHYGAHVLHS